jgi:glycosyltransferase 2 family protein
LVKSVFRWAILGLTIGLVLKSLIDNGSAMAKLPAAAPVPLAIGLGLTLLAHCWSGWVWGWLLASCGAPQPGRWAMATYLKTNIAKYLPGNIWHFYGRVRACEGRSIPLSIAVLSLVLEPLLMAASALALALMRVGSGHLIWLQGLGLVAILLGIWPRFLNPLLGKLGRGKLKGLDRQKLDRKALDQQGLDQSIDGQPIASQSLDPQSPLALTHYPVLGLLGEFGFVLLRGLGFVAIVTAWSSLSTDQIVPILSGFSGAWLLGLVLPGAPGGIGVFEATALASLAGLLPVPVLLAAIVGYRLVSTIAELLGFGLGVVILRREHAG